jgi:hypothetical protein
MANMIAALKHLHRQGIIHGDIRPGNLLLTSQGIAKLADFGSSKMKYETMWRGMGLSYAAPETLQGRILTEASDVFWAGLVILYIINKPHFIERGTKFEEVKNQLGSAEARVRAPNALPANVLPEVKTLLGRMLALEPTNRPTAADVWEEFERLRFRFFTDVSGAAVRRMLQRAEVAPTLSECAGAREWEAELGALRQELAKARGQGAIAAAKDSLLRAREEVAKIRVELAATARDRDKWKSEAERLGEELSKAKESDRSMRATNDPQGAEVHGFTRALEEAQRMPPPSPEGPEVPDGQAHREGLMRHCDAARPTTGARHHVSSVSANERVGCRWANRLEVGRDFDAPEGDGNRSQRLSR